MPSYPYLTGQAVIYSEKNLEEVAAILSKALFGGAPFGGKEDYIYDEVPAVYISDKAAPLGLRIILQGNGGKLGYRLELHSDTNLPADQADNATFEPIDLSDYLALLLGDVAGISVKSFSSH